MDKIKILCIIGASGSGKTTVEKMLSEYWPNVFSRVISHTTRPMREGEHEGDEHIFHSQSYGMRIVRQQRENLLAYTIFGGFYYWTDTIALVDNKVNTYVIDVEGYHDMVRKWGNEYDIRVLYVKRPNKGNIDKVRKERDKGREQLSPDEIDFVLNNDRDSFDYLYLFLQGLTSLIVSAFTLPHIDDVKLHGIMQSVKE